MPDEVTVDNQNAPVADAGTQETPGATEQSEQPAQTSEATNQEFNESWTPEMQSVWTKKSTEIKQELTKQQEKFAKELETFKTKAESYDKWNSDPRVHEAFRMYDEAQKKVEPQTQIPEITREEIEAAQTDPDAQARLFQKLEQRNEIKMKSLEERLNMTSQELAHTRLTSAIVDFSREAENWDELENAGIINPLLEQYRTAYPKANEMQVVEAAYKHGKKVYDKLMASVEAKQKALAQKLVSEKKQASGDTGMLSNTPLKPIKAKNWKDVFSEGADDAGYK